jgi:predicted N-acetyltransferase YhbS
MGHPVNNRPDALPDVVRVTLPDKQELIIRGARPSDIRALSHIYCESYAVNGADENWTPKSATGLLTKLYRDNPGLSLVAQVGQTIVGATFGNTRPWESGKTILEGKELFVSPSWQKHGIANELLKERIHRAEVWGHANQVEIITFSQTPEPQGFHERTGFRKEEDLQIMSAPLSVIKEGLNHRSGKE